MYVAAKNVGGRSGYSGYSGAGATGVSGFSGYSAAGTSGFSGYSGRSGFSGYSGAGTSGFSGYSSNSGFSGYSGTSGYSGYSGAIGTSGFSGYSGRSGFSGYSGSSALGDMLLGTAQVVTASKTFNTNCFILENPAGTFGALIQAGAQTGNRTFTFPVTSNTTIATLNAQTFGGAQTFSSICNFNGNVNFNSGTSFANQVDFRNVTSTAPDNSTSPLTVTGAASQVANLIDIQDSTTATIAGFTGAGEVRTKTYGGTPSTTPADGTIVVDTSANKIWVRVGGTWKYATLT